MNQVIKTSLASLEVIHQADKITNEKRLTIYKVTTELGTMETTDFVYAMQCIINRIPV